MALIVRTSPRLQTGIAAALTPFASAVAAADTAPTPGISFASMLQTFAGLALILALFVGAAWLMRRMNGGRGLLGGEGPLRIVGGLSVGTRERIVLVEIEDTWLVVGIAPGQMRTLHVLPKGAAPLPPAAGDGQFGQWLRQFKDKRHEAAD